MPRFSITTVAASFNSAVTMVMAEHHPSPWMTAVALLFAALFLFSAAHDWLDGT